METIRRPREVQTKGTDTESLKQSILQWLVYAGGRDPEMATPREWFHATALAVRDRVVDRWIDTWRVYEEGGNKRLYYFSVEFLMGRLFGNNLDNLGLRPVFEQAIRELGRNPADILDLEPDAALGNGGLGRLAACFLDSMATLRLPGFGYGIRYEFGLFEQGIEDGVQVEHPENWLRFGNPWEFGRPDVVYPVAFHGRVEEYLDAAGQRRRRWVDTHQVMAMAFDTPIVGYGGETVNTLRLWSARAARDFDIADFNAGDYMQAVEEKVLSENISRVLYPNDETESGRELRLKQEFFFVSASLQDILRRYRQRHRGFDNLPAGVAVQLNDTHPALAVPELMRLLVDVYKVDWEQAWAITRATFSYTNHTLLPEALETWPIRLMERLLPRHMEIIYALNQDFLADNARRPPAQRREAAAVSLIDEQGERRVRMAHIAFIGSHKVNGVSALHTDLMRTTVFADLHRLFPDRIINKTNGITPRRWLHQANPGLSALIDRTIGTGWVTDLDRLAELGNHLDDADFMAAFRDVKFENKRRLAATLADRLNLHLDPHALFDVHIKRIHEYKRQLLNVLHTVALYNAMRAHPSGDWVPQAKIFAGKAAPSYHRAKLIIRLINDVAEAVNNDPVIDGRLKVVFIPNYNVTTAEVVIPAADLSEQISTAGMEASGTGNMKLALNGALTIGTHDGANIEIGEAVGDDNICFFGLTADRIEELRRTGAYDPRSIYHEDDRLRQVLDMIGDGAFSPGEPDRYRPLVDALLQGGDRYFVLADFADYLLAQERAVSGYRRPEEWFRKALVNTASMGWFSSDRTILEYASEIWQLLPRARAAE